MITFKVPSELYGQTDCVITDIERTLKTGYAPCGDGCDYKLTAFEIIALREIRSGAKKPAPTSGYILEWGEESKSGHGPGTFTHQYRATAQAYLKRTGKLLVKNDNGLYYRLEEIESSMLTTNRKFEFKFKGREIGAIGKYYTKKFTCLASSYDQALDLLLKAYEINNIINCKEAV